MQPHESLLVKLFELLGVGLDQGSASLADILVALGIY
ncbi:hypothetical protein CHAN_01285 [Corynebacterium hansenii]|nr:hypothetical protein CHAN_01285 [Corynebacterium hansenii]